MNKCFCPRMEVILLSLITFVLIISVHRYFDFVASFQTVTIAANMVAAKKSLHDYLNTTATPETRLRMDRLSLPENGKIRNDTYGIRNGNICSEINDLFVVVLVHTAIGNFERRKLIRNTWGNISMFQNHKMRIVFLLGKPDKNLYQRAINLESKLHGDIVQGTFIDTYHNLTNKAVLGLTWVTENCRQAKFVLKVDDDVVVNTPRLLKLLETKYAHVNRTIICTEVRPNGTARIFRGGKNKVENAQFPNMTYWPMTFCPGRFVIYTADLINELLSAVDTTSFLWLDDVYVTGLLAAKVDNVKHLIAEDISRQMEWWENATTTLLQIVWNRLSHSKSRFYHHSNLTNPTFKSWD